MSSPGSPVLDPVPEGLPTVGSSSALSDVFEPPQLNSVENYELIKTIGKGNFAKVKLARHRLTGVEVAIKIIDKTSMKESHLAKLDREVSIMKSLDHPNIVKLYEVIDTERKLYLVMEYASGGEVFDYLVSHGRMKEKEARIKFRQIVSAIQYCHAKGIVHRDLKAENLLLDKDLDIKIADFGFANMYEEGVKLNTFCGSPPYAAPELFQGREYYGPEVDVWSLGVILFTLVSGALPFDGANIKELRDRVVRGKYRIPFYMSTDCERLLRRFLVLVPSKRCNLTKILSDGWMNTDHADNPLTPWVHPDPNLENPECLTLMKGFGFRVEDVEEALKEGKYNHATATYYLLADSELRETLLLKNKPALVRPASMTVLTKASASTVNQRRSTLAMSMTAGDVAASRPTGKRLPQIPNSKRPGTLNDTTARRSKTVAVPTPGPLADMLATTGPMNPPKTATGVGSAEPVSSAPRARRRRTVTEGATRPEAEAGVLTGMRRRLKSSFRRQSSSDTKNAKPRSLRFTFSMNNTSSKPPEHIIDELKKALLANDITFEHEDSFTLICEHGDLLFEMEVCKLPRLLMNGIRHKRIGGPSLAYKNICTKVLNEINL
eukprot:m.87635 g.87635  ORF g.87635 m.87635 type:complete len:607 (+) comp14787_c0_seq1:264-2084(+)